MSGIVCLGWGSLIWDPRTLPLKDHERPWHTDGPKLPVEFASKSYRGHVTLVLVQDGRAIPTLWAYLNASSLEEARQKLSEREWSSADPHDVVGIWSHHRAEQSLHSPTIAEWAQRKQFDGVVWTKLPPKFPTPGMMPTEAQVVEYLASLDGDERARAKHYVERTPRQVETQYRPAIEQRLGWKYDGSLTDPQIQYPNGCLSFGVGR